MEELKKNLIRQARSRYKRIYPCGCKKYLSECFTTYGNELSFWFNTEDRSTRLLACKLPAWQ